MCDTFVALRYATVDGSVVFGKNSDREPNEAHEVVLVPAASHPPGSQVRCTYVSVPQVERTHAVLLAKPYWMWGAEMGANEHGVVIGNEAVFTKVRREPQPGLLGMDLLRLALERADTARAAVEVIADLLAEFGQGGNAGYRHRLQYDNSFLVADPGEAWVLETAGRQWAAERVTSYRSISNAITISTAWDLASDRLVAHAVEKGWCQDGATFDYGRCYSDVVYTRFSAARARQCRTTALLAERAGEVTPATAMRALRDHGRDDESAWTPGHGLLGQDVCAHAGAGPVRVSQTTGSLVAHLTPTGHTYWVTATSAPCMSVFVPVWLTAGLPDLGPPPGRTYDAATLWWRHEDLHRETLRDYAGRLALYRRDRDDLEASFRDAAATALAGSAEDRLACSALCLAQSQDAAKRWLGEVRRSPLGGRRHGRGRLHALAWRRFDAQARRPS